MKVPCYFFLILIIPEVTLFFLFVSCFEALSWNVDDMFPPSERFIYNFKSKEELKKWHLYSDSEYGGAYFFFYIIMIKKKILYTIYYFTGLSSAALEITDAGNEQSGGTG